MAIKSSHLPVHPFIHVSKTRSISIVIHHNFGNKRLEDPMEKRTAWCMVYGRYFDS